MQSPRWARVLQTVHMHAWYLNVLGCVGDVCACVYQAGNTPLKIAKQYKKIKTAKVIADAGGKVWNRGIKPLVV